LARKYIERRDIISSIYFLSKCPPSQRMLSKSRRCGEFGGSRLGWALQTAKVPTLSRNQAQSRRWGVFCWGGHFKRPKCPPCQEIKHKPAGQPQDSQRTVAGGPQDSRSIAAGQLQHMQRARDSCARPPAPPENQAARKKISLLMRPASLPRTPGESRNRSATVRALVARP